MRLGSVLLLSLACLCLGASTAWAVNPLKVSSNGRYLVEDDGSDTPFLWLGGTAWAGFLKTSRADLDLYLDNRRNKQINVIQAVAHWWPLLGTGARLNNAANFYGHRPFAGGADSPDTSQPLVVSGGSPTNPNDYWDHADYFVNAVEARGMYLAILPFWGSAFVNLRTVGNHIEYDQTSAKLYGEFLGNRYKSKTHIIWVLGGDTDPTYGQDQRSIYRALAEGIVKGVTGQTVAWNQSHSAWDSVLMTYHPAGNSPSSSSWFHTDPWLDFNGMETWHFQYEIYNKMKSDYNLTPVKPTMNLEPHYEGAYDMVPNSPGATPLDARRQAYQCYLAGGAGHTYGAINSSNNDGPLWSFAPGWENTLDYPGLVDIGHLFDLLTARKWWTFIPDQEILASGASSGVTQKVAVKSSAGDRILVYFGNNSSANIRLDRITTTTKADGTWFDPRNANTQSAGTYSTSKTVSFSPPDGWEDALLEFVGSGGGGPVEVFQHYDYAGWAESFDVGEYNLVTHNDDGSSIKVAAGYKATVYEHYDLAGGYKEFTAGDSRFTSDETLSNGASLNDNVSSIRVEIDGTALYQHCDYGGWQAVFEVGDYTKSDLINAGGVNEDVSSVRVASGYKVTLYEHDNFTGASLALTADDTCLSGEGFNDQASSLRVENVPRVQLPPPPRSLRLK